MSDFVQYCDNHIGFMIFLLSVEICIYLIMTHEKDF